MKSFLLMPCFLVLAMALSGVAATPGSASAAHTGSSGASKPQARPGYFSAFVHHHRHHRHHHHHRR